jgi:hypothetical protein
VLEVGISEIGDAFGTAVEDGLFAKAVGKGSQAQPEHRELEDGHFAEGACLNCDTELLGGHCHASGQKAHLHRTVGAFMHDLLHGALHFDGKTWKTLPMLALKPDELTRHYNAGERKRFVSPMALFLFSIFLMFAVFQFVSLTAPSDINSTDALQDNLDRLAERAEEERDEARERLGAALRGYDHAIFITYSIAFMSLLFIVISVPAKTGAPEWLYGTMIAFIPPMHFYKQLRGAYAQRGRSAIWRLAVLMVFINIVALLFLQLLLLLGAF